MRGLWRQILFVLFLIVATSVGWFGFAFYESYTYQTPETVRVVFAKGTGVSEISQTLLENKLIRSDLFFKIYLRASEQAQKLKAGEYEIKAGSTMKDVAALLASGKTVRYPFTIPEGFTLADICAKLSKQKFMEDAECQTLVRDTSFLKDPKVADSLEGYLFPETYLFDKLTTPRQMIQMMVDQFYLHVTDDVQKKLLERGLSLHRWVTFASLVEKETGVADERPLIAGVFYNRLKEGMLLQTDPSVIYGVKNFDGNLTRKHLETDSPYNTYTRNGLPIGPIASPGWGALYAVLNPQETNAYYFVAKGAGRHYFSKNLQQHNRAVQYFIFKRGEMPEPGEEIQSTR